MVVMKGEEMTGKDISILKNQLEFYKKNDMEVHILRTDSRFYNGKILELAGDMIILDDCKLGPMPLFFMEIDTVEKFRRKK